MWAGPMLRFESGHRGTVSLRNQKCLCVCAQGFNRAFLWVVDFWLNNLRTLFLNCGRAMFIFFFLRCSSAAMSPLTRGASTVVNTDLDCHLRLPSVPLLEAAVMSLIASPPPPFSPSLVVESQ